MANAQHSAALQVAEDDLRAFTAGVLQAADLRPVDAETVASVLVAITAFDEPAAFKERLSYLLERVKASPRTEGSAEILVAGEKEQRATEQSRALGVPLDPEVATVLAGLAARYDVRLPFPPLQ